MAGPSGESPIPRTLPAAWVSQADLALGLVTAACGNDDGVEKSVSAAAEAAENAANDPSEANAEKAESALEDAAKAIRARYDSIVGDFDKAEAKIADESKADYTAAQNDVAAIEADLVKAADSTGSAQADAWKSAMKKAKSLSEKAGKSESAGDQAAADAFDNLAKGMDELATEIEHGLGLN